MKIYSTKHALSTGIILYEAYPYTQGRDAAGCEILVVERRYSPLYLVGEGIEWHRTKQAASARMEKMREAALLTARRRVTKLEDLDSTQVIDSTKIGGAK